jgi:hypothetical protein
MPPAPFEENPEVLSQAAARDGTAGVEEGGVVRDPAVIHLAHRIRARAEELRAAEPVLSAVRGEKVFDALLAGPDRHRGQPVAVRGNLVAEGEGLTALLRRALPSENATGLDRLFRSYLLDEHGKLFLVYTLAKARELPNMEAVGLRAYFCRLFTGEAEYRGLKGTIPLLVAEDYELLPPPASSPPHPGFIVLAVLILPALAAGVILLLSRRGSRC